MWRVLIIVTHKQPHLISHKIDINKKKPIIDFEIIYLPQTNLTDS